MTPFRALTALGDWVSTTIPSVAGIAQEQRIPQGWIVGTLDECVAKTAAFIHEYGLTDIVTWAVPPGLRPDQMNRHLERYAAELVPRLKQLFSS